MSFSLIPAGVTRMRLLPCLDRHFGRTRFGVLTVSLAAVLLFGRVAPVQAGLIINPTYDSSITSDPNAAAIEATIQTAINTYQSLFTNPVTVNIKFQEMSSGLGAS